MNDNSASTIRIVWSPAPGSEEAIARSRRLPSAAASALAAAWVAYGAALVLPAAAWTQGYECLLGTLVSLFAAALGDVESLRPASLLIPNIFMFLSPLVLIGALRRGPVMKYLTAGGVFGAALAVAFPLSLLSWPLLVASCGGSGPSAFRPEIGTYVWVASQLLLAAAFVLSGRAAREAR